VNVVTPTRISSLVWLANRRFKPDFNASKTQTGWFT
jgi:hypothetical protein